MTPERLLVDRCIAIAPGDFAGAMDALGNAFVLVALIFLLSHIDWWLWERQFRRFPRRRRLARIRAARVSA